MVQRIQSLWLLLASLSVFLLFFFSIASFSPNPEFANNKAVVFDFYAYGLDYADPYSYTMEELNLYSPLLKYTVVAVLAVCVLTPFLVIFMYRNRSRQMQLSRLTILLNAALMLSFFLLSDYFSKETLSLVDYGNSIGIFVPMVAIVFLLLSIRFIKKDDLLVRSADRIR